jgi:hypothetical protein
LVLSGYGEAGPKVSSRIGKSFRLAQDPGTGVRCGCLKEKKEIPAQQ